MMHVTQQQEEFSRAYIYAVAAAAGLKFQGATAPDDDSVDVTISVRRTARHHALAASGHPDQVPKERGDR